MPDISTYTAIRFGTGIADNQKPASGPVEMLANLEQPDRMTDRFPTSGFADRLKMSVNLIKLRKARRKKNATEEIQARFYAQRKEIRKIAFSDTLNHAARAIYSPDGFRERLGMFWADHFTIRQRGDGYQGSQAVYVTEAIRPHIAGRFADMLRAAVTHPLMLDYLDQVVSVGPNSKFGKAKKRGLNENLAREVLELHTLGVGGPYTQKDVTQLAELFTGMTVDRQTGFKFQPNIAEPGAERVLGRKYGGWWPRMSHIEAALEDLALHPSTARHLARKLVVHFISDTPDKGMVDDVAAAYRDSEGDLMATYTALLNHPLAFQNFGQKAKRPDEFLISAVRALEIPAKSFLSLKERKAGQYFFGPMAAMGMRHQRPTGPDGWPEELDAWLSPQGLAARIQWSMAVPGQIRKPLPDANAFLKVALADAASPDLTWAVSVSETKREAIGLIFASPEFNRR